MHDNIWPHNFSSVLQGWLCGCTYFVCGKWRCFSCACDVIRRTCYVWSHGTNDGDRPANITVHDKNLIAKLRLSATRIVECWKSSVVSASTAVAFFRVNTDLLVAFGSIIWGTANQYNCLWRWQLQCLTKRWISLNIRSGWSPKAGVLHWNTGAKSKGQK